MKRWRKRRDRELESLLRLGLARKCGCCCGAGCEWVVGNMDEEQQATCIYCSGTGILEGEEEPYDDAVPF